MPTKHCRILAIDPGTRKMGVALLEGERILYHEVKVIPERRSPHARLREGRKIILRLLRDLSPQVLAYEKTFFGNNRNAALLNVFADEIRLIGKRKGLTVVGYAPSAAKKFVAGNGWASKADVARAIVLIYPELKVFLTQDRKWKEAYHHHMFDAIAVGMTASGYRA